MTEYAYDLKLFAVARIERDDLTDEQARQLLDTYVQSVDIDYDLQADDGTRITITEASVDGEPDLMEIDGESPDA